MKRCPTCNRTYEDDSLSFCLEDGTPLVVVPSYDPQATIKIPATRLTNNAPTEVLPEEERPRHRGSSVAEKYGAVASSPYSERKKSALPWILGAALILGVSAIVVAWIVTRNNGSNSPQIAQRTENTSQSSNASKTTEPSTSITTDNSVEPSVISSPAPVIDTTTKTQTSKTPEASATAKPTPPTKSTPEAVEPPQPKPTPPPAPRAPISGGVLNGKAISLPQPAYPSIARAAHASGTVTVQVLLDESGKVISASVVSGHALLRESALRAAYAARFSPTLLSGQPVMVTGLITYNFQPQ